MKVLTTTLSALINTITVFIFFTACQKEASVDAKQTTASPGSSIIYTDVNPDSTIICTGGLTSQIIQKVYSLDLNKDGIADFILLVQYQRLDRCTQGYSNLVRVSSASGSSNQVAIINSFAGALDTLAAINASVSTWGSGGILEEYNYQCEICDGGRCGGGLYGNWINGSVKYLALKLIKGKNTYYCWVRLSVTMGPWSKLTVMDYAYNSSSNQPIAAGQTK